MALARTETQIQWSAADTVSVSSGATATSDALTFQTNTWAAAVQLMADNAGTPASGDRITFRVLYTTGDVADDTGDDYDTAEHGTLLAIIDTWSSNTPGEDPARVTVPLPTVAAKAIKIQATSGAASNSITVSARLVELNGAPA